MGNAAALKYAGLCIVNGPILCVNKMPKKLHGDTVFNCCGILVPLSVAAKAASASLECRLQEERSCHGAIDRHPRVVVVVELVAAVLLLHCCVWP